MSCCRVHCCLRRSSSDSARASSSRSSTTRRSWKAIRVRKVAFASSRADTSSNDEREGLVIARSWVPWVGDKFISLRDPLEICLVGLGITNDAGRNGEVNGLAAEIGVVAVFVGGMLKLILLRRGE